MPEIFLILMLAVVVVAAIVFFKVAKGVLQGILLVSAVLSIVSGIAAVFVVRDALDFQNHFEASGKLLLFTADNSTKITSGILIKGGDENASGEAIKPLSGAEVEQFNAAFSKEDYATMKGDNFKLIILKEEPILSAMPETIDAEGSGVSREMVLQQLKASSPEQRASVLSALFASQFSRDPLLIISGYKKGNIVIYPETAVFKVVRFLPEVLFRKVAEKLLQGNLQTGIVSKAQAKSAAAA